MIIKNDNVKVKRNYEGYAEQVIAKLIKSDTEHKLFFNILNDKSIQVPLISIQDDLKPLYRVTKKSISYLNKLFKKYKIEIITDSKSIKRLVPSIQMNEPYKCKSRCNGKVKIIKPKANCIMYHKPACKSYPEYNPNVILGNTYLPMVINHGNWNPLNIRYRNVLSLPWQPLNHKQTKAYAFTDRLF